MLRAINVHKSFNGEEILKGVNLHVRKGEVYGLIGPNGAGKTTLLKICMALLRSDQGSVELHGYDIISNLDFLHESVGYMPRNFGVYDNMKVLEYLKFYGALQGVSFPVNNYWMELLDLVNLTETAEENVNTLSKGMRQRIGIARCLVHNPMMLIFDEPYSGLDPVGKQEMVKVMQKLKDIGKTVFLTSNVLVEMKDLCTRIGIMKEGNIIVEGTMDELVNKMTREKRIKIDILNQFENAMNILKQNQYVTRITIDKNTCIIGFSGDEEKEAKLLSELVANGVEVVSYSKMDSNREDLFWDIGREVNGGREAYENQSSLFKRFKIKRQ